MGFPRIKHYSHARMAIFLLLCYIFVLHVVFWDTEKRNNHYYIITDDSKYPRADEDNIIIGDIPDTKYFHILARKDIDRLHKATKILQKEYGNGHLDIGNLAYHLNVLQTRVFPDGTRKDKCNNCFPYTFSNIISPWDVCGGTNKIDMLMIITTVPKATVARRVMRETWLSYTRNNTANTRYVFLFGGGWDAKNQEILRNESRIYGDILQDDFKDAYYNLTQKVLMGYKWALKNCKRATFVLRTADDNFINVPDMVKEIQRNEIPWKRGQIGRVMRNLYINREKKYKWYISEKETPNKIYPDYAIGTAFLFSMESVREVVAMSPHIPFYPIEDAYFGFLLRELRMKVIHSQGFNVEIYEKRLTDIQKGLCPFEDGSWFAMHLVDPPEMAMIWQQCVHKKIVKSGKPPRTFNGWFVIRPFN